MIYEPISQIAAASLTGGLAWQGLEYFHSDFHRMWLRWYFTFSCLQILLVEAIGFDYVVNGVLGAILIIPAGLAFCAVHLPALLFLGGEEVIERHGILLPTFAYEIVLLAYCWILAILVEGGRRLTSGVRAM